MRLLVLGLLVAAVVWIASGGHVLFLPLLFLPLMTFGGARRRRSRRYF